ncbi:MULTISPECIES: VTT domain-containing protein [Rhizobium]|uniref:Membrane-associated protein n=1 Tax=Rhizobium tropici TaxID=398 RepID=A0A329Y924_RHITR|nr:MULTISPECIES: VTT domain-containing protein [Rhizobium]MBB3290471.1 membrane protein DedA with SNARE-associated domain [Rhizobium sp. BK252]MBB3405211.1 membrane protein DedA with SNARE-associated domain [Rhizobium sp. BK289]MBB3417798.1 membrane protein DedA with SNARE-associated domain [Rhizobium sp. BK284]MBB3485677.1 membrane protein DedA with SNARE-associated domain [Rhizobium sp. BK347]MDK4717939.1 VTT domain-containing protein [Rhizobium sp. CNPSo 3968]
MDPLGNLVGWIALYGMFGLFAIGLAERFLPALPSYGVLVAIGIAADDEVWSLHTAVIGTTVGSLIGALGLYLLVRAVGKKRTSALLYSVGGWVGLSRPRIDWTLSSLRERERALTILSQLIPTVRLISPVAAGLLGTSTLRFVAGASIGIVLWNGLFIAGGYLAVLAIPGINSSALALKILILLVTAELLVASVWRLQRRYRARPAFGASKR